MPRLLLDKADKILTERDMFASARDGVGEKIWAIIRFPLPSLYRNSVYSASEKER